MAQPGLSADEVLAWLEKTSENWKALIEAHPEILEMPCDVMGVSTVGRTAAAYCCGGAAVTWTSSPGLPPTEYAAIPFDSAAAIYATHERAMNDAAGAAGERDGDWEAKFEFVTRSMGPARSSRKSVLFHAMLHGIRHYAQLATLVRQHGIKPGWPMDYLAMDIERA
jgi:hypothetical protein